MILQAKNISKRYGNHLAVDNIQLQFKRGTFNAILGPNGAGKSTTISMLIGLKQPTQGEIIYEPGTKIGVVFQTSVLDEMLTVRENLTIRAKQYKGLKPDRVSDLIGRLGLSVFQKQKYGTLSGGQKRRVDIARALLSQPDILFLDEPTAAMDTSTRQHFWQIIQSLKAKGVTIFYSSHYIEEVEHTAERILVLHHGKLLRDTTPFAMREAEHEKQLTLPKNFLPIVEKLPHIDNIELKNDTVTFMTKEIDSVWQKLQEQGCQIADIEIQNKTLLNTLFDQTQEDEK